MTPSPQKMGLKTTDSPETYFRGMSSLCRRLLDDMGDIKATWGDNWHSLSYEEQCRILDQAIVDEATVRKYDAQGDGDGGGDDVPQCHYFPKLKLPTGQKVVCDEHLSARGYSCSWRDEHSAPFSWHTRSQMDLALLTPPSTPLGTGPIPPAQKVPNRPIVESGAVYTSKQMNSKEAHPSRFRWHYDPPDNVLTSNSPDRSESVTLEAQEIQCKPNSFMHHAVLTQDNCKGGGFLVRLRNVLTLLTGSCLPLHACMGPNLNHTIHSTVAQSQPPEFRSQQVLELAKFVNESQKMDQANANDYQSTVPSDYCTPATDTTNTNNSFSSNDKIALFSVNFRFDEELNLIENQLNNTDVLYQTEECPLLPKSKLQQEEELPLINLSTCNESNIPKTGFDFLDNW